MGMRFSLVTSGLIRREWGGGFSEVWIGELAEVLKREQYEEVVRLMLVEMFYVLASSVSARSSLFTKSVAVESALV